MKSSDKKEIEAFIALELVNSENNPDFLNWLFKNFHIEPKQSGNAFKDKTETFYETKINCKNCKNEIDVQIPIGMDAREYMKKNKCEICQCNLK